MAIRNALADIRTMNALFTAAENEAIALGDEQPGDEHLFLAALTLDDASARTALSGLGASADDVRSAIAKVHTTALDSVGIDGGDDGLPDGPRVARPTAGLYRSTGSLQDMFQEARRLAATDKPSMLRTAHIAIAAAKREHGTIARVLVPLGIDRARLAEAAHAEVVS
jgi:ATP-dependent Clp protease ATP-binding subunit ClpA